jgi:transposase
MEHATYFLTAAQYQWLATQLPEPAAATGHPPLPNRELLGGILFVLKTGCRWQDIPKSLCRHGYVSCWRRLQYWQQYGGLERVWRQLCQLLSQQGHLDMRLGNLDGSAVQTPRFAGTGYSGKHRRYATNLSLLTDKHGLPLSLVLSPGNRHDQYSAAATLLKLSLHRGWRVSTLNADKGYDANHFRRYLSERAIMANIPPRQFTGRDRSQVPYNQQLAGWRFTVERTFAWLKSFRRLRYRWERRWQMFQAFVELGCLLICLRRVEF